MNRKRSSVWQFFTVSTTDKSLAQCNLCREKLKGSHSTNLKRHIERKHHSVELLPPSTAKKTRVSTMKI